MLIGMTVWEIKSPTVLRKGFLPIATTRGDRLFIGLLAAAYLNLAFVGMSAEDGGLVLARQRTVDLVQLRALDGCCWPDPAQRLSGALSHMASGPMLPRRPVHQTARGSFQQETDDETFTLDVLAVAVAAAALMLSACGKKEEPRPPRRHRPPARQRPPPPAPRPRKKWIDSEFQPSHPDQGAADGRDEVVHRRRGQAQGQGRERDLGGVRDHHHARVREQDDGQGLRARSPASRSSTT